MAARQKAFADGLEEESDTFEEHEMTRKDADQAEDAMDVDVAREGLPGEPPAFGTAGSDENAETAFPGTGDSVETPFSFSSPPPGFKPLDATRVSSPRILEFFASRCSVCFSRFSSLSMPSHRRPSLDVVAASWKSRGPNTLSTRAGVWSSNVRTRSVTFPRNPRR